MPDYDPDNIPVLDDIIEEGLTDNLKKVREDDFVETDDTENEAAAFDISLFLNESDTEQILTADAGPEPGDLNGFLVEQPDNAETIQYPYEDDAGARYSNESWLSEYYADDDNAAVINMQAAEASSRETAPQLAVEPIPVGALVKDIIKELMPDLEQQLVFLLQKAIEEKLPKELIKSPNKDKKPDQEN